MNLHFFIVLKTRQGQMCTRCLRNTDALFAPEEDVSYIGTEDDDEQSLMDLIRSSEPGTPIVYRSSLNIKVVSKSERIFIGSIAFTPKKLHLRLGWKS